MSVDTTTRADRERATEMAGALADPVRAEDVRNFALQGLTRRLSIVGVPLETVA